MIEALLTKATLYRKEFGQQHKVNTVTYLGIAVKRNSATFY